jgi:membrane protein DedA with SNARE-associated domain
VEEITSFIITHGYLVLVIWVFADQLGVPVPAVPVLIAAGALAGKGDLDLGTTLLASTLGCLPSDFIWFEAGRRRGGAILSLLCKVSLEPDSCVRSTENMFARYGPRSLVFAKLIPGYQTLSPALAGMSRMSLLRFFAYDIPGAFVWSALFIGAGYVFHNQIDRGFQLAARLGSGLGILVVGSILLYIGWKFYVRHRFIKSLRVARIQPHELMQLIEDGHEPSIVDLRNAIAIEMEPRRIPGSTVVSIEDIDERHVEIPRERDIVLYCT